MKSKMSKSKCLVAKIKFNDFEASHKILIIWVIRNLNRIRLEFTKIYGKKIIFRVVV